MNKSKFLKKSLAMVLAIMMVVAMIPLSASADTAFVNDGYVVSIAATNGTLTEESAGVWNDSVAYDEDTETITIDTAATEKYDEIQYKIDDGEVETYSDSIEVTGLEAGVTKKISFNGYNTETEETSTTYVVNVTRAVASANTKIEKATITVGGKEISGEVNNTAKTISFELPWGKTIAVDASNNINVTLEDPTSSADDEGVEVFAVSDGKITVQAQNGNTAKYTINETEAACLLTLSVGGVKAVPAVDEDGEKIEDTYEVTLPVSADLSEKQVVSFTVADSYATAKIGTSTADTSIKSGDEYLFNEGDYKIAFTDKNSNTKEYTLKVAQAKSNDTTISAFTATVGGYTENGTVSGDKLTVTLPAKSSLESVKLDFTVVDGTTVKINNSTDVSAVNLTKPVVVVVTAADGKTVAYYQLTATVAEEVNNNPAINSAKMTIGAGDDAKEYVAKISDKTITFTVPYATKDTEIKDATYSWALSFATQTGSIQYGTDIFEDKNTIKVTSDSTDAVTYTIVYNKEDPKTGKTLDKISLTEADKLDAVTTENTYTASIKNNVISVVLPWSLYNKTEQTLTAQFEIPEGAKFYNTTDGKVYNELKSGFDSETEIAYPMATTKVQWLINDTTNKSVYVVADETAAMQIETGTTTVEELKAAPFKGHVTLYTLDVKQADPSYENALVSFGDDAGKVTSKISGNTVEVSVPKTATSFDAVVEASKGATVKLGTKAFDSESNSVKIAGDPAGLSYDDEAFTSISVTSEAGETRVYNVKVVVRDIETSAEISSVKVNKTTATISGKTITATLPYGSDLSKVTLDVATKSIMANVVYNPTGSEETLEDGSKVTYYDVTNGMKITVTSEDGATVNNYTLTVKVADQFTDVDADSWYADYVTQAAAAGIIVGVGDGRFNPKGNITRGDFAVMTVRMLGVDVSSYTTTPFSDVDNSKYYMQAIAYCADKGIIGGVGDGRFAPESYITREQAAKILAVALGLDGTSTEKFNDDANIAGWAKTYVYACKAAGIFEGDNNGNFNPKKNITRAEAAKVMVVALSK